MNQDKVAKEAKAKARKQQASKSSYDDDRTAIADAPRQWSDYTVQFKFPEPTELPPPLLQLIDVECVLGRGVGWRLAGGWWLGLGVSWRRGLRWAG